MAALPWDSLALESLSYGELVIRLLLAAIIGFVLGYDRKQKNKPLGYQAFSIICIITCLIAIMGSELYAHYTDADNGILHLDLSRIIAGTLTGIGFLGAGAIMKRDDDKVVGTTTGASVWSSGALGLMVGFGFYNLAILGFLLIWFILAAVPRLFS